MKTKYDFSQGKRGSVLPTTGKTRITMYLDDDVLESFRAKADKEGKGYQTLINEELRKATITPTTATLDSTVTIEILRKVIREELHLH
jgi:uncharacterized protein (DUF4415 family)